MNKCISIFALVLLLLVCGLQILGWTVNKESKHVGLSQLQSFQYPGWTRSNVPLGDTPEMKEIVLDVLGYDEATSWELQSNGKTLQVYAAYWAGGKRSAKEVGTHTPDVCWINAGWKRDAIGKLKLADINALRFTPAESRVFNQNGNTIYVIFWHVFGDRVISYGAREPSFWDGINDLIENGLKGKQEQFFIRISSSDKIESFESFPMFNDLKEKIIFIAPGIMSKKN
jgi:hypothetical protein